MAADAVAPLLGINVELLDRWASGQDAPNAHGRLQLADLDALVGHLHGAFTPAQAMDWMCSPNAQLGSRPEKIEVSGSVQRTEGEPADEVSRAAVRWVREMSWRRGLGVLWQRTTPVPRST